MSKYSLFIYINLLLIMCMMFNGGVLAETSEPVTEQVVEETEPIAEVVEEVPKNTYLGEFKLTAYCPCAKCCGKNDGITATGTKATANRTIAVDPKVIPIGTQVLIGDRTYIAEDVGGAIKDNIIDVYFDDHTEALKFGVQYAEVYKVG